MTKYLTKNNMLWAFFFGVVFEILYLAQSYNYLFFHITVEVMSVVPSIMIFMVVLYLWNYLDDNNFLSFIGISLLFIGIIDFVHMMAYQGMPIFVNYDANLSTQLWVLARYVQMISFVIAAVLIDRNRQINKEKIIIIYTFVVLVMLWSIFISKTFPDTFIDGSGLTRFKVMSEYIISLGLFLCGVIIWKKRERFTRNMVQVLLLSIFFQIISELSFSSYVNVFGFENFLGHYFKVVWVILLYRAILGPALESSRELLFKELVASEKQLKESEEKYRLITDNVNDVISVYNITKNKFVYISPSIMTLRGFTVEEAMNERLEDGVLPENQAQIKKVLEENVKEFKNNPSKFKRFVSQRQLVCKNGDLIWVELSIRFHLNVEGDILSTTLIRNIEERKKSEEKLIHLSYHDQLTDLYNRRFYEEELLRLDTERNLPIALIMADVNGLKLTNDAFGHQAGDELLKNIAQIFRKVCRSDEIISRIGGDEFVILLPKCNESQARLLIERLNDAISKDKKTNALLSVSMGYAIKESVLMKMNEVFKEAEDDMYRHKLAENLSMRSKNIDLIMNSLFEKSNRERLHSDRVAEICEKIASNMNINQEVIQQIRIAAVLHDIGKIGISDSILNKNGKLDTSEWEEMRKHSEIGYRILSTVSEFSEIAEYVLSHQERWDGKGYPDGLKGEDIPVQARIIAIADAFDAMTVKRSYRDAMSETEAVAEIKKYAGTQFDPEIARVFVEKVMNLTW